MFRKPHTGFNYWSLLILFATRVILCIHGHLHNVLEHHHDISGVAFSHFQVQKQNFQKGKKMMYRLRRKTGKKTNTSLYLR